jgi:biotin carboxyl carrier protein
MEKDNLETFRVYIAEYKTKLTKKFLARKPWTRPNPNNILAVIPGTVLSIKVKKKQQLKEGTVLLILEAMKMENRVTMPFDGVIKSINVEVGEIVPKNKIMIEISPN